MARTLSTYNFGNQGRTMDAYLDGQIWELSLKKDLGGAHYHTVVQQLYKSAQLKGGKARIRKVDDDTLVVQFYQKP